MDYIVYSLTGNRTQVPHTIGRGIHHLAAVATNVHNTILSCIYNPVKTLQYPSPLQDQDILEHTQTVLPLYGSGGG
jgi:hypothetical protein